MDTLATGVVCPNCGYGMGGATKPVTLEGYYILIQKKQDAVDISDPASYNVAHALQVSDVKLDGDMRLVSAWAHNGSWELETKGPRWHAMDTGGRSHNDWLAPEHYVLVPLEYATAREQDHPDTPEYAIGLRGAGEHLKDFLGDFMLEYRASGAIPANECAYRRLVARSDARLLAQAKRERDLPF